MSSNKNVLQQKTYVVIPFYTVELGGNIDNFSKEEKLCFNFHIIIIKIESQKEKKLRGKNVQYMNAYEIFKDRKKLSLTEGKFCLFEHIDEYPLFFDLFLH
mgnify:CR=1 FL=1